MSPADFEEGAPPDEAAVESYLSMLVSAAAGNQKKNEQMQRKVEMIKAKKEQELQVLKSQMELEKQKFDELMLNVESLKSSTIEASEKEKELKDKLERGQYSNCVCVCVLTFVFVFFVSFADQAELDLYKTKFAMLSENVEASHKMLETSLQKERNLSDRVAELEKILQDRDDTITEQSEEIASLNSEIYKMHNEIQDMGKWHLCMCVCVCVLTFVSLCVE